MRTRPTWERRVKDKSDTPPNQPLQLTGPQSRPPAGELCRSAAEGIGDGGR